MGINAFNLPSAVGRSKADFAKPEKIEMKDPIDRPVFHLGSGFPSYFTRTMAIITMQTRPNTQLRISNIHHSRNHLVNQVRARSPIVNPTRGDEVKLMAVVLSADSSCKEIVLNDDFENVFCSASFSYNSNGRGGSRGRGIPYSVQILGTRHVQMEILV